MHKGILQDDLLDTLIEQADAKAQTSPAEVLREIAARLEALQSGIFLHPKRVILRMNHCHCASCVRSWTQEEGLYLYSESRNGKTKETRLISFLSPSYSPLPRSIERGEDQIFPFCFSCFKVKQ
ncbi:MAG: hypothetical protein DA330_00995 [Nitrososphaera sp.]|nr:hypothetical protein [Nitrososphaera sp.]